jgi:hypothetical protein
LQSWRSRLLSLSNGHANPRRKQYQVIERAIFGENRQVVGSLAGCLLGIRGLIDHLAARAENLDQEIAYARLVIDDPNDA